MALAGWVTFYSLESLAGLSGLSLFILIFFFLLLSVRDDRYDWVALANARIDSPKVTLFCPVPYVSVFPFSSLLVNFPSKAANWALLALFFLSFSPSEHFPVRPSRSRRMSAIRRFGQGRTVPPLYCSPLHIHEYRIDPRSSTHRMMYSEEAATRENMPSKGALSQFIHLSSLREFSPVLAVAGMGYTQEPAKKKAHKTNSGMIRIQQERSSFPTSRETKGGLLCQRACQKRLGSVGSGRGVWCDRDALVALSWRKPRCELQAASQGSGERFMQGKKVLGMCGMWGHFGDCCRASRYLIAFLLFIRRRRH